MNLPGRSSIRESLKLSHSFVVLLQATTCLTLKTLYSSFILVQLLKKHSMHFCSKENEQLAYVCNV